MMHLTPISSLPWRASRSASLESTVRVVSSTKLRSVRSNSNFDLVQFSLFLRQISRIHLLETGRMRLTIATEEGATFNVDVDSSMELDDFAALLEAEVSRASSQ